MCVCHFFILLFSIPSMPQADQILKELCSDEAGTEMNTVLPETPRESLFTLSAHWWEGHTNSVHHPQAWCALSYSLVAQMDGPHVVLRCLEQTMTRTWAQETSAITQGSPSFVQWWMPKVTLMFASVQQGVIRRIFMESSIWEGVVG